MLSNFLLMAARNFFREQVYAIINVLGLVVGLAASIFIFLWVMDEVRYDRFHNDYDRIYEVMENQTYSDGEIVTYDATPAPLAEKLKSEFPEVETACHVTWEQKFLFSSGPKSIYNEGVYADESFFRLFTFPVIEGNPDRLLPDPNSIVISRDMAARFFGKTSALGKVLRIDNAWEAKVTAVVENVPPSRVWFEFVLPFQQYARTSSSPLDWGHHKVFTYLKLQAQTSGEEFSGKIRDVLAPTNIDGEIIHVFLHPLKDWRLVSKFENGKPSGGRIFYVITFAVVAIFILIAACINFMNLATARAARRAREVGIRKVAGASRSLLIQQFMIESLLLSFCSLFIALLLVHLLTPLFNHLCNKELSLDYGDPVLVGGLVGLTIFAGLLAGSYPAFFLSSFRPASVLKGNLFSAHRGGNLRKSLVLFQFGLSVVLIVSAFVINDQVSYILNKDLGFDKDHVFFFQPRPGSLKDFSSFKHELLQDPRIRFVGQGYDNPLSIYNNDVAQWNGLPGDEMVTVQTTQCDPDYLNAIGYQLVAGRNFSPELASDSTSFVINEELARLMGFRNPLGQRLKIYNIEGHVIGVVKNFHNRDLYGSIDPVAFVRGTEGNKPMTVFVRYEAGQLQGAVEHMSAVYRKFESAFPLELEFLDKNMEGVYRREIMTGRLSVCFTVIIIFISCLGLFGLTLFTTERRTREIGVRKVLGASTEGLVVMLCRDFMKPIAYSLVLGFPVAYYVMTEFLTQYQFHTELSSGVFLFTGAGLVVMALITISYQSMKAALTNPAETLRSE